MNDTIDKARTFQLLRQRGITRALVGFSGGNDEGGADDITAYSADGSTIELPHSNAYEGQDWDEVTRTWKPTGWVVHSGKGQSRLATPEEIESAQLWELLEAPVYAEYGSFAGDFSVSGTVIWDVAAETVHMDRSEQVWTDTDGVDF